MLPVDLLKINTDTVHLPLTEQKGVEIKMLRLDNIHPVILGNKWFKLKYHLENFQAGNFEGVLTFGGAWSNHIVASACACQMRNIKSIGIIRGERPEFPSATLLEAEKYNMELKFVSREIYRQKTNADILASIQKEFPGYYIVPEGGAGPDGEKGAAEILNFTDGDNYTHIACAVGTATMFNGISGSAEKGINIIGIPVLKGWKENPPTSTSKFFTDYHFGGYARYNSKLIDSMNDFFKHTGIPTDFVYTGKLVYAILDLVKNSFFSAGSKILVIHSGGLQGNLSLPKGSLIFSI